MSGPLDFRDDEDDGPRGERRAGESGPPSPPQTRPWGVTGGRLAAAGGLGRWGWVVGVVALVVIALLMLRALHDNTTPATGVRAGAKLPPFAAPLALGALADKDVNVATKAGQGQAGARPACEVRGPDVLNVCELAERGPVVLAFLATRGGDCTPELDRLETIRRSFPGVQVAAVAIRGDRDGLRRLIRRHGWGFPVGYDRDGVLASLYGVAVCPQVTYAYPGGAVRGTVFGQEPAAALRGRFGRLVAASRERGWRAPSN